jgi:single-stranded DNA-binding protein
MHYNRTFILGAVDRQAVVGQATQSGDTPINFSVVVETINPQTGQVAKSFLAVTYWIRSGQRPPFDPAQLVPGALVFVEGKSYPELYQKNDGTTGAVNKLTASSVGIPHTVSAQQQQPPAQQYQQPPQQAQPAAYPAQPAAQPPYQQQPPAAQPYQQQPPAGAYQQPSQVAQPYQQQAPPANPYAGQAPAQQQQQQQAPPANPFAGGGNPPF